MRPGPALALAGRRAESRGCLARAFGPAAGLEALDPLLGEPSLQSYHLLPSVRGDLLARLGRFDEAQSELQRAILLTDNARERQLLLDRAAACAWEAGRKAS